MATVAGGDLLVRLMIDVAEVKDVMRELVDTSVDHTRAIRRLDEDVRRTRATVGRVQQAVEALGQSLADLAGDLDVTQSTTVALSALATKQERKIERSTRILSTVVETLSDHEARLSKLDDESDPEDHD